jgi:sporulation protein YlmC with PRC-barrel domain
MRTILFAAAAVSTLACAAAMAQNTSPNTPAKETNTTVSPPASANPSDMNPPASAPRTTAQDVPAQGPNFISLQNSDMLSSNVVGLDIYNDQNNDLGKIQDIAFDSSKKITGYILSVGGFLGMGTHYVAVDPDAIAVKYDANNKTWRATMNATKDELKSAPEFKYGGQWTASRS